MTVQISGASRESDRIRLIANTKRERFGNEAFPSIFGEQVKNLKNKKSYLLQSKHAENLNATQTNLQLNDPVR